MEEWDEGTLLSTDGLLYRCITPTFPVTALPVVGCSMSCGIFPVQGILWPVFHHVVDVYGDQVMRFFTQDTMADLWQCYANVNRRFRDKIVEVCSWVPFGCLLWVFVYPLLFCECFGILSCFVRFWDVCVLSSLPEMDHPC